MEHSAAINNITTDIAVELSQQLMQDLMEHSLHSMHVAPISILNSNKRGQS